MHWSVHIAQRQMPTQIHIGLWVNFSLSASVFVSVLYRVVWTHYKCSRQQVQFFLEDISTFVGPLIPCFGLLVTSPLGFKARVGSLIRTWWRHTCYMFPKIHLWCDTCWCSMASYINNHATTASQCETSQTLYRRLGINKFDLSSFQNY